MWVSGTRTGVTYFTCLCGRHAASAKDNKLVGQARDMNTLSFVVVVEARAKIGELKLIVKEILELARNAAHFIVGYFSCARLPMCLVSP